MRSTRLSRLTTDDTGVATVLGACAIAGLVGLVVAMMFVGSAVVARHRAQSAADLAALAAAQRVMMALDDPCGAARVIAAASNVAISQCRTAGDDVVVRTTVHVDLGPFGGGDASAVARAGPTE